MIKRCRICRKSKGPFRIQGKGSHTACRPCENRLFGAYIKSLKNSKDGRAKLRRWTTEARRRWRKRNPEKVRARMVFYRAVFAGKILRPKRCTQCGVKCRPHGHHTDYSKPLAVEWLCPKCHKGRHVKTTARFNPSLGPCIIETLIRVRRLGGGGGIIESERKIK